MTLASLGRMVSPALREQERLRIEAEEHVALDRLETMFATHVEVPRLPALAAPAGLAPAAEVRSLTRGRVSSRRSKAKAPSAWPVSGVGAAKVA